GIAELNADDILNRHLKIDVQLVRIEFKRLTHRAIRDRIFNFVLIACSQNAARIAQRYILADAKCMIDGVASWVEWSTEEISTAHAIVRLRRRGVSFRHTQPGCAECFLVK